MNCIVNTAPNNHTSWQGSQQFGPHCTNGLTVVRKLPVIKSLCVTFHVLFMETRKILNFRIPFKWLKFIDI